MGSSEWSLVSSELPPKDRSVDSISLSGSWYAIVAAFRPWLVELVRRASGGHPGGRGAGRDRGLVQGWLVPVVVWLYQAASYSSGLRQPSRFWTRTELYQPSMYSNKAFSASVRVNQWLR